MRCLETKSQTQSSIDKNSKPLLVPLFVPSHDVKPLPPPCPFSSSYSFAPHKKKVPHSDSLASCTQAGGPTSKKRWAGLIFIIIIIVTSGHYYFPPPSPDFCYRRTLASCLNCAARDLHLHNQQLPIILVHSTWISRSNRCPGC